MIGHRSRRRKKIPNETWWRYRHIPPPTIIQQHGRRMFRQFLYDRHHGKFPRFDYHGQKRIHQPGYIIEACRHPAIFRLSCIRKLHGYIDTRMYRLVDDGQQFFKESFRNFMGMLLNDRREFSLCTENHQWQTRIQKSILESVQGYRRSISAIMKKG